MNRNSLRRVLAIVLRDFRNHRLEIAFLGALIAFQIFSVNIGASFALSSSNPLAAAGETLAALTPITWLIICAAVMNTAFRIVRTDTRDSPCAWRVLPITPRELLLAKLFAIAGTFCGFTAFCAALSYAIAAGPSSLVFTSFWLSILGLMPIALSMILFSSVSTNALLAIIGAGFFVFFAALFACAVHFYWFLLGYPFEYVLESAIVAAGDQFLLVLPGIYLNVSTGDQIAYALWGTATLLICLALRYQGASARKTLFVCAILWCPTSYVVRVIDTYLVQWAASVPATKVVTLSEAPLARVRVESFVLQHSLRGGSEVEVTVSVDGLPPNTFARLVDLNTDFIDPQDPQSRESLRLNLDPDPQLRELCGTFPIPLTDGGLAALPPDLQPALRPHITNTHTLQFKRFFPIQSEKPGYADFAGYATLDLYRYLPSRRIPFAEGYSLRNNGATLKVRAAKDEVDGTSLQVIENRIMIPFTRHLYEKIFQPTGAGAYHQHAWPQRPEPLLAVVDRAEKSSELISTECDFPLFGMLHEASSEPIPDSANARELLQLDSEYVGTWTVAVPRALVKATYLSQECPEPVLFDCEMAEVPLPARFDPLQTQESEQP